LTTIIKQKESFSKESIKDYWTHSIM
jgi:hypothetical protein